MIIYRTLCKKPQNSVESDSCSFGTVKGHYIKAFDNLLHGDERAVFGDSAYNKNDDKRQARAGCTKMLHNSQHYAPCPTFIYAERT